MNAWAFRLRPIADFLRRKTPSRLGWGALASIPSLALAGPSGENVVAGGAIVSRPNATHTQVDQSTARAVVNWSTFSVDSDEYVVFNQPGATASILNRVVGGNQSQIFGQIDANGRVFLVNPQGVYFAPGAQVNAAALTASVMDITDNNFMSGNYVFTRPANAPDGATVENAGQINVSDGGFVVLAGDYANNTGIISARLGSVVLAAGSQMTLDLSEDGLVSFAVDEATVSSLAGANNAGQILADGGQIIMTAKVANDLVATAVNNDGLLQARRIVADGGEIYLAAAGADIVQAGTIDVSGADGQSGGEVGITGDADITLTAGSEINANGSGAGNGGTVNVIADGMMAFRRDADITARAGADGDTGGKVELSGHEGIQIRGNLQLGKGGELLIDPPVVKLVDSSGSYGGSYGSTIGVGFIEDQLNSNVAVSVLASNAIVASAGVIDVTATSGSGALTLQVTGAGGGAPVSYSFFGSPGGPLMVSDGNIDLAGVEFNLFGDFTASAGSVVGDVNLGKVTAGNVRIIAGTTSGNITLNTGGIAAASTSLKLSAADDITIGNTMNPGGLSLVGTDVLIDLDAGGDINVAGNVMASGTTGSADIDANAGGNITMNNVIAMAQWDADMSFNAGGGINVNNVNALADTGSASIDFTAGGNIMTNNVTARASSDSVFIDFFAANDLIVNGITTAVARNELSISYSASNNVTINNTINATANSNSYASIEIRAQNNVTTRSINALGSNSGGSAFVTINAATGNVAVNGTITARGSFDDAEIDIDAGGNIIVGTSTTPGGLVTTGSDAWIDLNAGGNVVVHGTLNASASLGTASIDIDAGTDIDIDDVIAYGVGFARVGLSAGRDIIANNVEAELGLGSYGGSFGGSAIINFFAERDITAGNFEAIGGESGGRATVIINSNRLLKVKNVRAEAMGTGSGSYGGSNARIYLDAFSGIDAMNLAASAVAGSASIDLFTTNGNIKTLGLKSWSSDGFAGVYLQGNRTASTITVGGAVEVSGTAAMFSASAFNVNLNSTVDLTAPSYVSMWADAANNLVTNGKITANEAGGGFLDVALYGRKATTINGDVMLKGGAGSYVYLDIGTHTESAAPMNTVTTKGNISVMSGMLANATIFGRDVMIPGTITVRGGGTAASGNINAGLGILALNNLTVGGAVLVQNSVGNAGAQLVSGGNMNVGKLTVTGGMNGQAFALFNASGPAGSIPIPSAVPLGTGVKFNGVVDATGGKGSLLIANAKNSLMSAPGSKLKSMNGEFGVWESGTTSLNLTTQIMSTTIRGPGQTPNVRYDNRAFIGPSSVTFGSTAVMKAASFFASGPLTFNGSLRADNLAVAVTGGAVTFSGPVNITGATPFLATAPDLALFDIMSQRGLLPPGHGPNVQIFAQNGININQSFNVGGPSPYTKMYTNGPFNISGLTTSSSNLLAVFSPIDTTRPIFFEDEPYQQPLGASAFFNFPTISGLPDNSNVTIVIGERGPAAPLLNGPFTIGARGLIDLGARNMFILTRGTVSGDDTVITDGIFEVVGLAQNDVFQVPLVNEFSEDTNSAEEEDDEDDDEDEIAFGDDDGDDGDDGGVTQEGSGSESMECS